MHTTSPPIRTNQAHDDSPSIVHCPSTLGRAWAATLRLKPGISTGTLIFCTSLLFSLACNATFWHAALARARNRGLNGDRRQTTPELAQIPGLLNFPLVTACGSSTEVSLPCMFSRN